MTTNGQGGLPRPDDVVSLTVDGIPITVPKGTLIIRAAEQVGVQIPRFCDHPLLDPIGACRQCIVEVEGQRKPLTACTTTCTDGMAVKTQLSSPMAAKAQVGTMEMLLINHPLDCPICDKGGECPLQNQSLANGSAESRFRDTKRTYPKPIAISSQVLLDRERCVLCARCTRYSLQIAGDPFIELFERGALEQVAIYEDEPFESYFSGNTVQICPVGALTGAAYRFRARPFDLVSTPSVCEHCASGCQQRTDWRRGRVLRRLAGEDPAVNEEWNCDKGRWAFTYATAGDRLTSPAVRDADGYLVDASWSEALAAAARGLAGARGRAGVLTGGRLTIEDAYAYAKFARVVLATNDIDFRARPHSREEQDFLAAEVAGRYLTVTYEDIERAPAVLLAGFEPEEESPIVFLRLRKAVRRGLSVTSIAPLASRGLDKLSGRLLRTLPGDEARTLDMLTLPDSAEGEVAAAAQDLRLPGALLLVGDRLGSCPGALSAAARLARASGARIGWVPRRAGDRGAVEAGALPNLLPGGRWVGNAASRAEVAAVWGSEPPAERGRDLTGILTAARDGELDALLVAGVDVDDLPDPQLAEEALAAVPFVVSLELRSSAVTDRADVVLPVAPSVEKAGAYVNWEGRLRPFDATLERTGALADGRVLHALAAELEVDLGAATVEDVQDELGRLGAADPNSHPGDPAVPAAGQPRPAAGQALLATWHLLLDDGRLQDGEPFLAGTRRKTRALLSAATAAEIGAADGGWLRVATGRGSVTVPLAVADVADRVVWLPSYSPGSHVHRALGAAGGALVTVEAAEPPVQGAAPVPAEESA